MKLWSSLIPPNSSFLLPPFCSPSTSLAVQEAKEREARITADFETLKEEYARLVAEQIVAEACEKCDKDECECDKEEDDEIKKEKDV